MGCDEGPQLTQAWSSLDKKSPQALSTIRELRRGCLWHRILVAGPRWARLLSHSASRWLVVPRSQPELSPHPTPTGVLFASLLSDLLFPTPHLPPSCLDGAHPR